MSDTKGKKEKGTKKICCNRGTPGFNERTKQAKWLTVDGLHALEAAVIRDSGPGRKPRIC